MYCDWPELGRCCFCMPLRRGVLTFGYIHLLFSIFMICIHCLSIKYAMMSEWLIYGRFMIVPAEISVTFYCLELIFDGLLIYGAHKKGLMCLKAFYYYTLLSCVAMLIVQIIDITKISRMFLSDPFEMFIMAFAGLCLQVYLLIQVRSLIRKLEISGPHVYENQLHQIVSGEIKVETNGIYNTTLEPTCV